MDDWHAKAEAVIYSLSIIFCIAYIVVVSIWRFA